MMANIDLFVWWAISISGGSIFLAAVGVYLYMKHCAGLKAGSHITKNVFGLLKDFIFIWVLLGLLVFYIISIRIGSAGIFALGNIFVEAILFIYLLKNRHGKSEDEPH